MTAFYSVVALEQLLNQLSNSDQLLKEELAPLLEKITSLKSSLENIFPAPRKERDEANKLAAEIREKIFEAQDKIESFISTQSHIHSSTPVSLQEIIAYIDPIVYEAKKLGDSIKAGMKYSQPVDESQTYKSSAASGQRNKIVGQEIYKAEIEKKLLASTGSRLVIPICGMPCVGKTTLAKSIYDDVQFMKSFPYKAWVTVFQDDNVQDIFGKMLHSLESRGRKAGDKKKKGKEAKLQVELHQALSNNKYLVVIDDMWDEDIWRRIIYALPDNENSSRVLLTTRMLHLANFVNFADFLTMEPLNPDDSWRLLRNRAFGDDDKECPEHLVNIGRDIATHCKGLPLSLNVIGGLLSQGSKEPEYWERIEEETCAATANEWTHSAYLKILSLSYDYLPCNLRVCILYMGAFPEDSDIPVSKLIRLWIAEGFLTIAPPPVVDKVAELSQAEQSLLDLIDRNLVFVRRSKSNGKIRSCGMHYNLNDLAVKESERDTFSHSRRRYSEKPDDNTDFQRRVSVHRNILICLEDVCNSTKTIKKASSLQYVGPHHRHDPMPFSLNFDLHRVLDAFTVYFIRFPDEFLKLLHLKYLSFIYDGSLPSKIASLHKLQVVIVKRQPKIVFVGMPFLPYEIWRTKELRHLPTEPAGTFLVDKPQTLSNVNADSCYEKVLESAPSLKRLGMWMEGPKKVDFHINKLNHLEIFKFIVLNPNLNPTLKVQPKFYFPSTLRKLRLSGTGLPWGEMEAIAALPNLQVLKLKELAFHGEEWRPTYTFVKLKYLLIEYLNLRKWEADSSHFPSLEQLIFRHCYELVEFPSDIQRMENLQLIELVDCSPNADHWAEGIKRDMENFGHKTPKVSIYSSWE